ncbi:MAG: D-alanyl-D-alanine carboxypeptidase [Candidatus Omnitrophica bacterium]|nr:D-alanyl-D-alanine carboxypeptidase [Candidatus Omnitrophota bacterium]
MSVLLRNVVVFFLVIVLSVPSQAFAARNKKKIKRSPRPTAVAAVLWDATANHRYYAKNLDAKVYPASTTKVMTALLALERLPLDKYVTVSETAIQVQETKLNLKPGEQYRVRDLLFAVLLKSANDAANVLAEAAAGSQAQFVAMMNQKARAVGAKHTLFANAHGLPSDAQQYTTAHDMALLFAQAFKNPFFRKAITFKYRIIYSKEGRRYFLKSHNKSLFLNWKRNVYGKTGYTRQAQSCFVGYFIKRNHVYVIGVFGCRKRWEDIKFIIERYGGVNL